MSLVYDLLFFIAKETNAHAMKNMCSTVDTVSVLVSRDEAVV